MEHNFRHCRLLFISSNYGYTILKDSYLGAAVGMLVKGTPVDHNHVVVDNRGDVAEERTGLAGFEGRGTGSN